MTGTAVIPLSRGKMAIVDSDDLPLLSQRKWWALKSGKKSSVRWYAYASFRMDGRNKNVLMHRYILGTPRGVQIDHRDGDGLNNTRRNLRVCNNSQNSANKGARSRCGYKGVTDFGSGQYRFQAHITERGKNVGLGRFSCVLDAARAYDVAAQAVHGEFALLNFPHEDQSDGQTRVGKIVSRAAHGLGLSLRQIADIAEIPVSTLSVLANGKKRITMAIAMKIAPVIGVLPRELLVAQVDDDLDCPHEAMGRHRS